MRKDLLDSLKRYFVPGALASVVCNQWGDSGKGKILDLLMEMGLFGVRGMGADNCGHTLFANGQKIVTHMIPSSIVRDGVGVFSVIGRGVAFNPLTARNELKELGAAGVTWKNLKISFRAKLTMPYHVLFDRLSEALVNPDKKIGTTGRGVGPVFQDHYGRSGLVVGDLLDADVLRSKIEHALKDRVAFLKTLDPRVIAEILDHEHLENGRFFHPIEMLKIDAIVDRYVEHGDFFREMICDAEALLRENLGKGIIALEGAQGLGLDIDYGSYPFVTSSRCTVSGLTEGAGLRECDVTHKIGVVKAYITRVGEGAMPTEIGGYNAVEIFRKKYESTFDGVDFKDLINHMNPVVQGAAIGRVGGEFGATTNRLRRIGWLDLPGLRHAMYYNGPRIAVTKLDILTGIERIPVCVEYRYVGPDNPAVGLKSGQKLSVMMPEDFILRQCEPIYEYLEGWTEDISGVTCFDDLPFNAKRYLTFIERKTSASVDIVGVGPDREQTFFA